MRGPPFRKRKQTVAMLPSSFRVERCYGKSSREMGRTGMLGLAFHAKRQAGHPG
jgi:hypothetical protein